MEITKINAGYHIMQYEVYREGVAPSGIEYKNAVVLGLNKKGMWVTWEWSNSSEFFWGHYFESENDARKDYHARLMNNYDLPWSD